MIIIRVNDGHVDDSPAQCHGAACDRSGQDTAGASVDE
jgi:hypothetical protein